MVTYDVKKLYEILVFQSFIQRGPYNKDTFEHDNPKDYVKPYLGCVLKMKNGKIILIGDVNELFGECDCCVMTYEESSIVEMAHISQIVWNIFGVKKEDKEMNLKIQSNYFEQEIKDADNDKVG
jgi:hypothetical protein